MTHHERHHAHEHEHGPPHPPGAMGYRLGECPCSQCGEMSREEEIKLLQDYRRDIRERLDHVERRLGELQK